MNVTILGGDGNVTYPTTVNVAQGSSTATFTVNSSTVTAIDKETLSASAVGTSGSISGLLIVNPLPVIKSISFSPSSVIGGNASTATVHLSGAAPTGGLTVTISGGDVNVSYQTTVTVPAGATSAPFTVSTLAVSAIDKETLQASAMGTPAPVSGTLNVDP
jgi:hypothetical protein